MSLAAGIALGALAVSLFIVVLVVNLARDVRAGQISDMALRMKMQEALPIVTSIARAAKEHADAQNELVRDLMRAMGEGRVEAQMIEFLQGELSSSNRALEQEARVANARIMALLNPAAAQGMATPHLPMPRSSGPDGFRSSPVADTPIDTLELPLSESPTTPSRNGAVRRERPVTPEEYRGEMDSRMADEGIDAGVHG